MINWLYSKVFGGAETPKKTAQPPESPTTVKDAPPTDSADASHPVDSPTTLKPTSLPELETKSGPESPKTEPESSSDSSTGAESPKGDNVSEVNSKRNGIPTEAPQSAKKQKITNDEESTGLQPDWDEMYARLESFQKEFG
jgi:hypothetical protein